MKQYIKSSVLNLSDMPFEARYDLARDRKTPPEYLAELAESTERGVLDAVAQNPSTPPYVLVRLVNRHRVTDFVVARNPNLPRQLMELFATHSGHYLTRVSLAENRGTPVDILIKLAMDPNTEVREMAACNPHLPEEFMWRIATQDIPQVVKFVALNPSASNDLLKYMAYSSPNWLVRETARGSLAERGIAI